MALIDALAATATNNMSAVRSWLESIVYGPQRQKYLRTLAGFALVYGLNRTLNTIAKNHWQIRRQGIAWRFPEEVALVTGGCSGFGLLIAKGLAPKVKKVVVLDVSDPPDDLQRIPNVAFYKCDITSPEAVQKVGDDVKSVHGVVTILINNAGIATSHTLLDTTPEYLEKVFRVNVFSHWYLIQQFLPDMLAMKKGHILALASMASYASCPNLIDYCATKHAVLALHDGLNQELKHRYANGRCIQTSAVHPMWARTPLVDSWSKPMVRAKAPVLEPSSVADAVVKQVLSARPGQIYVPGKFSLASGLHGFPNWLQELIRDGNQAVTDTR